MRLLARLSGILDAPVLALGRAASFLFIPLMLVIVYDVVQRKITGSSPGFTGTIFYIPSTLLQELEWHIHGVLFLLVLGYVYLHNAHVRIEIVRERLSPRAKIWLELAGIVLLLMPFCAFGVTYGWSFAERAYMTNEVSSAQGGLPARWIIKSFIPIGFALLAASGLSMLLKCVVRLRDPAARLANDAALGTEHEIPAGESLEPLLPHDERGGR